MKRSSYRSSYAAVLGFKFGQRLQGSLVADHARDLTPAGDVGRLSFGGGLRLGRHLGGQQLAKFGRHGHGARIEVVRNQAKMSKKTEVPLSGGALGMATYPASQVGTICWKRLRMPSRPLLAPVAAGL